VLPGSVSPFTVSLGKAVTTVSGFWRRRLLFYIADQRVTAGKVAGGTQGRANQGALATS